VQANVFHEGLVDRSEHASARQPTLEQRAKQFLGLGCEHLSDRAADAGALRRLQPREALLGVLYVVDEPTRMRTVPNALQRTRLGRGS
jgi:hypothetical protein